MSSRYETTIDSQNENKAEHLCILTFSPINRDGRVLRQVEYLSQHFAVTVIGYGNLPAHLTECATMISIQPPTGVGPARKLRSALWWPLGRLMPQLAYEQWYWSRPDYQMALQTAVELQPDLIHANDWQTLPVAIRTAEATGAKVLLDLHEYSPLQYENRRSWRLWRHPMVNYFLRRYGPAVDTYVTVGQLIAERYRKTFGFPLQVVMNAPRVTAERPFRPTDPKQINLIHHGVAVPDRKLELMIEMMALLDKRFTLHLMLVCSDRAYCAELQRRAAAEVPGRIHFHEPVAPAQIADRIADYDIGIFILPFTSFSYEAALPNKFFEFVAAGLAVCIGPSPEMKQLSERYDFGIVASDFEAATVANTLNALSAADIDRYKQNAIAARTFLNAEVEMGKLVAHHQALAVRDGTADSARQVEPIERAQLIGAGYVNND